MKLAPPFATPIFRAEVTMKASVGSHPIDRHVGALIRARRRSIGMSQNILAARVGLTFQQIQKYERGANRVSASMLYRIAKVLDAPLMAFFEGLPPTTSEGDGPAPPSVLKTLHELVETREGQAIADLFPKIASHQLRRAIAELVRTLATGG